MKPVSLTSLLNEAVKWMALIFLAATPRLLVAQAKNFHFIIGAGPAFPTGNFGGGHDASNVGYGLSLGVGVKQATSPLGFRIEGMYDDWNLAGYNGAAIGIGIKNHANGVLISATYDIPLGGTGRNRNNPITLYGIGGFGWLASGDGNTHLSGNIGGGFCFPLKDRLSAFVEARYHAITAATMTFIPVTFGLAF